MQDDGKYYIYRHIRLDTNEVFYIGKGSKDVIRNPYKRAFSKKNRNNYWRNIVNLTKYDIEIILESDNQEFIRNKEIEFIKIYGRKDLQLGTLVNFTNGGEGVLGYKFTEEQKLKMSNSHKGKKLSPETCKKLSLIKIGNTNHLGKLCSKHRAEAIGKGNKGKIRTQEMREKYSKSKLGKKMSEETKEKIRKSLLGRKYNKNK